MNSQRLQDRLYYGLGAAARRTGGSTDALRPNGKSYPTDKRNRFLRLLAAFLPIEGIGRPSGYGNALWQGLFDAAYTRQGDYLVQPDRTFFIAAQQQLLPVLCVQTNRTITVSRPGMQTNTASNPYGGYTGNGATVLMEGWPASMLAGGGKGESSAGLPTDLSVPYLSVLVPAVPGINLMPGDLITDDLERTLVIAASELTDLGWRLNAKLATT